MTWPTASQHGGVSRIWELEALSRLDEVASRCAFGRRDLDACLDGILDAAIFVTGADKGNVQLLDPSSGCLVIRAQRGFDQPFLDYFAFVPKKSDSSCGAALGQGQRVIVEDVASSEIFSGKPACEVLLQANVRAVQSTPLTCRRGRVVGILSTHFATPNSLREREMSFMDVLARRAADFVERTQMESSR